MVRIHYDHRNSAFHCSVFASVERRNHHRYRYHCRQSIAVCSDCFDVCLRRYCDHYFFLLHRAEERAGHFGFRRLADRHLLHTCRNCHTGQDFLTAVIGRNAAKGCSDDSEQPFVIQFAYFGSGLSCDFPVAITSCRPYRPCRPLEASSAHPSELPLHRLRL